LDTALLHALAGGAKDPDALQSALNIRSGDLAYHINKMVIQGFMDYEVRSAKAALMLTEQGFNATGGVKVQGVPASQSGGASAAQASAVAPQAKKEEKQEAKKEEAMAAKGKDKEDILHILRGVEEEEKKAAEHHKHPHHAEKKEAPRKAESPEEARKREAANRRFSKIQFYIKEYWAWMLLIIIAIAVFAIAIYSTMQKVV
jgi:Skp family chaperone for outer membrane proteins